MKWIHKVAAIGGTVGTGSQPPRPYFRHLWTYTHLNAMRRIDFRTFGPNDLEIRTDFSAQYENKGQVSIPCHARPLRPPISLFPPSPHLHRPRRLRKLIGPRVLLCVLLRSCVLLRGPH